MQSTRRTTRRGQTLLELLMATSIIAATLVPALRMMRDSLRISRQIELSQVMSTFACDKLEEQLAKTCGVWGTGDVTGSLAAEGYAELRFRVTRSDQFVDGGIPGQLMAMQATVWHDVNGDGGRSGNEPQVNYSTKLARMVSYEYEASGR